MIEKFYIRILWGRYMINKTSKCIGETEEYELGYKHGLSAGIYNTLVFLEKNGYINDSDFCELKKEVEKDNE